MTDTELRTATMDDIIRRLQDTDGKYQRTSIEALGWGMGKAQYGHLDAVHEAETAGLVTTSRSLASFVLMVELTEQGRAYKALTPEQAKLDEMAIALRELYTNVLNAYSNRNAGMYVAKVLYQLNTGQELGDISTDAEFLQFEEGMREEWWAKRDS